MRIPFRQGIVRCLDTGLLTVGPTHVTLNVLDTPTVITLAHGSTDYLYVEQRAVYNAWGPITPSVDQWLYWDLDTRTAARTFGITMVRPVIQNTPPLIPVQDQHWFNTSTGTMNVWNVTANRWIERIRVFACELNDGATPMSMSVNSPDFKGTQVGITQSTLAGVILTDVATGKPLRTADNKFLTGETKLQAITGATSQLKTEAIIVEAEAQENMPAYTIVKFVDFGKISAADQFTADAQQQFGIIESDANIGDIVIVTTTGVISHPAWEWSTMNALLYSDSQGQLSTIPIGNSAPIGIVIDINKILLFSANRSETEAIFPSSPTTLGMVKLSVPPVDPLNPIAVGDNDPRVVNALSKLGGLMSGYLILHADPTHPFGAATKQYVDNHTGGGGPSPTTPEVHVKTNSDFVPLTIGMPVYSSGVGFVARAAATNGVVSAIVGLVAEQEVGVWQPGSIQTAGIMDATTAQWDAVTGDLGGLTEGATYFIQVSPAGRLTKTPPSVIGQYVVKVGVALSSTQMFINTFGSILL